MSIALTAGATAATTLLTIAGTTWARWVRLPVDHSLPTWYQRHLQQLREGRADKLARRWDADNAPRDDGWAISGTDSHRTVVRPEPLPPIRPHRGGRHRATGPSTAQQLRDMRRASGELFQQLPDRESAVVALAALRGTPRAGVMGR